MSRRRSLACIAVCMLVAVSCASGTSSAPTSTTADREEPGSPGGAEARGRVAVARPRLRELAGAGGLRRSRPRTSTGSSSRGRCRCPGRPRTGTRVDHPGDRERHGLRPGSAEQRPRDRPGDRQGAVDAHVRQVPDRARTAPRSGTAGCTSPAAAARIVALDSKTGEELWSTKIAATETDGVDIQPTVVGGLVLAATVPISLDGPVQGRRPRRALGARREDRREGLDASTRSRARTCGGTRRSTRAVARGTRRRSTSSAGSSTGASPTRHRSPGTRSSPTGRAGPVRTSTPTRSSRCTSAPASSPGTTRAFRTTSSTTTCSSPRSRADQPAAPSS